MAAVGEAFQKPRLLPALLLFYTSIDVISSLTRPPTQADTSGDVFKKWVDDFMLPGSKLNCRSEDIWAARCGFLHTLTVESKLSRSGRARQLHYVDNKSKVADLQNKIDPTAQQHVIIWLGDYLDSFFGGIRRFSDQVERDPELQAVVYHHVKKLAVQETFSNA
jgi:hypothetical protein